MIHKTLKLLLLSIICLGSPALGHKIPKRLARPYWKTTSLKRPPLPRITATAPKIYLKGKRIERPFYAEQLSKPLPLQYKNFYPQSNFLTTSNQINRYFLAKNSLEIAKWRPIAQQRELFITQNIAAYQTSKRAISHPAQDDMAWLAEQIPPQTNYLLLGERHYFPQIQTQIALFIHELRAKYPQRHIMLFSEFVPQGKTWQEVREEPKIQAYIPVFFASQFEDIPVIGLEPALVHQTQHTQLTVNTDTDATRLQNVWTSIEGVRLRNNQWLKILAQYRQQYPDALFVIHGGSGHVDYMAPFSLSHSLKKHGVFTVMLTAETGQPFDAATSIRSPFDQYSNGQFPDRILQFQDEQLSRMAGFDIQIRIPTKKIYE